jgi:hypothetical protein
MGMMQVTTEATAGKTLSRRGLIAERGGRIAMPGGLPACRDRRSPPPSGPYGRGAIGTGFGFPGALGPLPLGGKGAGGPPGGT